MSVELTGLGVERWDVFEVRTRGKSIGDIVFQYQREEFPGCEKVVCFLQGVAFP
jgi:hypothetical protein